MPEEPLDHVARSPLPWRRLDTLRTECGLPADSHNTITRDALRAKAKKLGRTRIYMITCVTCLDTAQRWATWDDDPVEAIRREVNRYRRDDNDLLRKELLALAALVRAHRDEFDQFVAGLDRTTDLRAERRARQARKK